jgi:hypothetical protein
MSERISNAWQPVLTPDKQRPAGTDGERQGVRFAPKAAGRNSWNDSGAPRTDPGAAARHRAEYAFPIRAVQRPGRPGEVSPEANFFYAKILKDSRFKGLTPEVKQAFVNLLDRHKSDVGFLLGMRFFLERFSLDPKDPQKQLQIIGDIDKFSQTASYRLKPFLETGTQKKNIDGQTVSPADLGKMLLINSFGSFLIASLDNTQPQHGRDILNNTKNKILDGKVRFDVFDEAYEGTDFSYGYTDKNGIHLNLNRKGKSSPPETTIVHEENHFLNYLDDNDNTPVNHFLDEYRAFMVDYEVDLKHSLTARNEASIVDRILKYPNLKDAYNENNGDNPFHATIKVLQDKLARGETVSAEQLRVGITTGWGGETKPIVTTYLSKPGNDDNH